MNITRTTIGSLLALALASGTAFADPDHGRGHGHDAARWGQYGQERSQSNPGRHLGHYRQLRTGYLTDAQVAYAIRNRNSEVAQLRSMRSIDYTRIRIVRLTAAQKARLGISMLPAATLAYQPFTMGDGQPVAQLINSNSPIINILQSVVGGLIVQNAINNATGGAGGSGTLASVLLNSGIPLSDLLGIFMNNGILNAIVG